jgi:hypothetical protein
LAPIYPQVYFKTVNNSIENLQSDRGDDLSLINSVPYIPEASGNATYKSYAVRQINTGQITAPVLLFRLPIPTDYLGVPSGSVSFTVDYLFKSTIHPFSRKGTIEITADVDSTQIQLSDDYEFAGSDSTNSIAQLLDFSVFFLDASGAKYTGALGQIPNSVAVYYSNRQTGDAGKFNYSYSSTTYHS